MNVSAKPFSSEIHSRFCNVEKFNGDAPAFKPFSCRIRDFMVEIHPNWGPLLDQIKARTSPITKSMLGLSMTDGISHTNLAESFYAFIGKFISNALYIARDQIAEVGNGFEIWRRYHLEFRGGEREMQEDGLNQFMTFPRCNDVKKLDTHLDMWEKLKREHCMNLDDGFAYNLLHNLLPSEMRLETEVDDKVKTTLELMQWVRKRTHAMKRHEVQERLRRDRIKGTPASPLTETGVNAMPTKPGTGLSNRGRSSSPAPPPPGRPRSPGGRPADRPPRQAGASPGPGKKKFMPDPKFGGDKRACWHCGSTEHTRQQCDSYIKGRASNGGKHVAGKWEDSQDKVQLKAAIRKDDETDDDSDGESTASQCQAWVCRSGNKAEAQSLEGPKAAPTVVSNSFQELIDNMVDEEEREMIQALEGWAKVKSPKKSKKEKKKWIANVEMNAATLRAEVTDLEEDEELVLVDSGCGNHAAHKKKHFKGVAVTPSKGQKKGQVFILADETEMANEGEKLVTFRTEEGVKCSTVFQMTNVSMPIFSVRKLAKTHIAMFDRDEGYFEHKITGQRTRFFSMNGVYYMRIRVIPPDNLKSVAKAGFVRQA